MCRPELGFNCVNTTETPMPRHGHVAIMYRTFGYEDCAKFVEVDECGPLNRKNLTCPKCHATIENNQARIN